MFAIWQKMHLLSILLRDIDSLYIYRLIALFLSTLKKDNIKKYNTKSSAKNKKANFILNNPVKYPKTGNNIEIHKLAPKFFLSSCVWKSKVT